MEDKEIETGSAKPSREKYYLISKEKVIKLGEDGELFIDDKKFEFKDKGDRPTDIDNKAEAIQQTRAHYRNILNSQAENLIILSGAGTSVRLGKEGKVGKTMGELWELVSTQVDFDFKKFCADLKFNDLGDLEKLLSKANRAREFVTGNIELKIAKIEAIIRDNCTLVLPENSPHEILLNRVTKRKLKYPRVKIFTINYDTFFEQAAEIGGFTVIDGFSFATERTFRVSFFDLDLVVRERSRIKNEENFAPKVFHLYKMHGSINWGLKGRKVVQVENPPTPLMIFPRDTKYEHSFEQPYFEMMSRFQQSLRRENVLLISIGFSLGDKHVVTAIKEAVTQNPSLQILIVSRTIRNESEWIWFIEKAKIDSRITLVSEEFKDFAANYPEDKTVTQEEILRSSYG